MPVSQPLLIDGRVPYDMTIWGEHFKRAEYQRRHHVRYKAYVAIKGNGFVCQGCGGSGGEVEPVLDDGSGPWYDCGFCEGTGLVTRWMRGWWLTWQRQEKARRAELKKQPQEHAKATAAA